MTIYYCANPRGFYDDADFGPRTMMVPDPQWQRPTISVELLPGDSVAVGDEVIENTGEEPMTVTGVLDESVDHPLVSVNNPHCRLPVDALPITHERRVELLEGQAEGKLIREDAEGRPILVDLPPPTLEQLAASERRWRDNELSASDRIVARHRDERDLGVPLSMSDQEFTELLEYRQTLRDWPEDAAFPDAGNRPSLIL